MESKAKHTQLAIDLFCGCGGISVGLERAGFKVIAGIDIEKKYLASYSHNFPESKAINLDITKISAQDFFNQFELKPRDLTILVGGPPCQGFSKNVPRKNRFLEDPKNLLVKSFLDYCEYIQPEMILMENVAEMKNGFDQIYSLEVISRLVGAGYTVTSVVLNAADYGVPQRRRRAFFMANRYGVNYSIPRQTHKAPSKNQLSTNDLFGVPSHISVWDAIGDLPELEHGKGTEKTPYKFKPQNEFQELMRGQLAITSNHIARNMQPKQYERMSSLLPGQGNKDLPPHLQTKGGFSGAYGRLTKSMVSPTITRWVFHPGSGRWGHPVDIRTLSIREIARIQSFPDTFEFVGSFTDQAGQLGNAVPPLLAETIARSMLNQLATFRKATNLPQPTFSSGRLNEIA
jgi:DNA (cytosine-5)-methyltransferase 1